MAELTRFRIAGGAQGFNWLPVFVAEEFGLFRKHGLEIDYRKMGGVALATSAVLEGGAELAITPPEGVLRDFVDGGDLRIVAANAVRLPMSLVARPGITALSGLKGAKIGTSSLTEGTAIYTRILLADAGLSYPDDYDFELAGIHTTRWDALQAGTIDCAPQPAPWNFMAARAGYNLIGEVNAAIPEVIFTGLIGNAAWLDKNRDTIQRLLAALSAAHDITNDPAQEDRILPIFQRITTKDDAGLARQGLVYMRDMGMWPAKLAISDKALDTSIELMVRAGLLDDDARQKARGAFDPQYLAAAAE
ncbi:ABC transporter substrate-binding protein [Roseinatronobacter alkalisoli]|uniref:ABC transporter substrate-binding protein n=1 Tax=Roseinatronobacter alkalisoli TaxID=3028235 RepID=A0ABT5TCJ7_9RHOB|nr:ABC transporter substrate-binding protein [Roseinatronobacter sp. HJB301]MDD7972848.1 ABC transporter substrate-binding protein [Roseinatronobacter sp. HJB301]